MGVCVRVEGRRGEKRSHTREREREKDLSVWFRRLSTYKKKTNRDSENLPRVTRLGSDRLGSAVIFGLGLLDFLIFFILFYFIYFYFFWERKGFGSQISEVMSRPKPRRCVAVQGPE